MLSKCTNHCVLHSVRLQAVAIHDTLVQTGILPAGNHITSVNYHEHIDRNMCI